MNKAITIEDLKKTHGDNAKTVYNRIAKTGGFGNIGKDFVGGLPALDISGLSPELQKKIEEILGEYAAVGAEETLESLVKLRKDDLVALAHSRGIETVPDSLNKQEIAELILAANK